MTRHLRIPDHDRDHDDVDHGRGDGGRDDAFSPDVQSDPNLQQLHRPCSSW